MLEVFVRLIVAPFLKAYILIFGDDPEMIAYAGLAFVIYYGSMAVFAAALYEIAVERLHVDLCVKYYLKRRQIKKRIHRSARNKRRKQQLEQRVADRIQREGKTYRS